MRRDIFCPFCKTKSNLFYVYPWTSIYICKNRICSLLFAEPQLASEELSKHYRQFYYPQLNQDGRYRPTPEEVVRQRITSSISSFIDNTDNKRFLDFGCGTGTGLKIAKEMGFSAVGLELDEIAKARAQLLNRGCIIYNNIQDLLNNQEKFDFIFMNDVLEHVHNPIEVLKGLTGILKDDGLISIFTMNTRSLREFILKQRWESYTNPTHLFYFNFNSLRMALKLSGLDKVMRINKIIEYPHHNVARRTLQCLLQKLHIDSSLNILVRK